MLVRFSNNPFAQFFGIAYHNRLAIFFFFLISSIPVVLLKFYQFELLMVDMVPVSILGGALAIFLGFRNNSAYDRWWEARKIWGGIVNYSRTWTIHILGFARPVHSQGDVPDSEIRLWQKRMVYRHLAWLHGLNMHLRKRFDWDKLDDYISKEELERIKPLANKPTQLLRTQALELAEAYDVGIIEDFRHMELSRMLEEFFNLQGKAERIKNTIFPYYYNYFTRVFLWVFVILLPFGLSPLVGWGTIPMTVLIGFVFTILEKSGTITENPFEGRAADTPITTIVRAIEIDLRQMLDEDTDLKPEPVKRTRFGVMFQD